MEKRNRNIILFFEENDNVKCISSNMVRLYMNRFIIDEEERFEITGVFNLTRVPVIHVRRRDPKISMRNWIKDQHIIKTAFEKLEIFTLLKTDIHIFMGTTFYLEDSRMCWRFTSFNESLINFLQKLADKCCSTSSIALTLLNGENRGHHTKETVREEYEINFTSLSLNNDLENFLYDMSSPSTQISSFIKRSSDKRNLFLYEMQDEDELSDDRKFLYSRCKRFSLFLK